MQPGRKPPARSESERPDGGQAAQTSAAVAAAAAGCRVDDSPKASRTDGDRRRADRRRRPTRPWTDLFGPLRRAKGRRTSDLRGYVDRYSKQEVALLLAIFVLNVADAFFTMRWLQRGGREANPIMEFFLDIGPAAFLLQKCVVVGLWLVILLVHKNFRFARIGLYSAFAVYGALLILHFGILFFGIEPERRGDPGGANPRPPDSGHGEPIRPTSNGMTGSTRSTRSLTWTHANPISRSLSIS